MIRSQETCLEAAEFFPGRKDAGGDDGKVPALNKGWDFLLCKNYACK
jgi:hypothetical protein